MKISTAEGDSLPSDPRARAAVPPVSAADVIERMKSALDVKTDTQLADVLGISSKTIHSWRVRNSVPYESALIVALHHHVSLDYLIIGGLRKTTSDDEQVLDAAILRPKILHHLNERKHDLSSAGEDAILFLATELAMVIANSYGSDRHMMKMLVDGGYMTRDEFVRFLEEHGSLAKYDEFVTRLRNTKKRS